MKSREDRLTEALDSYTHFEGLMEGFEELKGYLKHTRAGMSHEQAVAEARTEAEDRILARAARQAAAPKPAATSRKATPAPSPRISARPQ